MILLTSVSFTQKWKLLKIFLLSVEPSSRIIIKRFLRLYEVSRSWSLSIWGVPCKPLQVSVITNSVNPSTITVDPQLWSLWRFIERCVSCRRTRVWGLLLNRSGFTVVTYPFLWDIVGCFTFKKLKGFQHETNQYEILRCPYWWIGVSKKKKW